MPCELSITAASKMASQQRCGVIFEAAVMETSQGNCKATSKADMEASQGNYTATSRAEMEVAMENSRS